MNSGYSWSIAGEAYRYLVSLPKRKRRSLERAIENLASHPFRAPLFTDRTPEGFLLEVIESEDCLITYHADHAARRILVTEIQPLP